MKISVGHLLLLPLLLLLCCHCFASVHGKVETGNQHRIYKMNHRFEDMKSDLRVNKERSKDHFQTTYGRADLPCPDSAVIAPCTCTLDFDNRTYVDCTLVESVDQLVAVFQQDFPVKELYEFSMANNSAITEFPSFMNGITFETVNLAPGPFILEDISENFLLDLKDRLKFLYIFDSKLTTDFFPFSTLPSMIQLEDLRISTSDINSLPPIRAPKLTSFYLLISYLESLVSGTFSIGTGPMTIWIDSNQINTIEAGSISFADQNSADSNELIHIDGYSNQLLSFQAGTFPLRNGPMYLHFPFNQISSIEPGSFILPASTDLLAIFLNLGYNELTTVDERVFGSIMPFVTFLEMIANPLTCGCDIAWLILNEDFFSRVDDDATCADGTNLHDLDPQLFIDLC